MIGSVPVKVLSSESPAIDLGQNKAILHTYITQINNKKLDKIKTKWAAQDIQIDSLENITEEDLTKFRKTKIIKNVAHENMLIVLCAECADCQIPIFTHKKCKDCHYNKRCILHTGDALMKTKKQLNGFVNQFGRLLNFVDYAQIPHHGSSSNHNSNFTTLFRFMGLCITLYYTIGGGSARPDITDIRVYPNQIKEISEAQDTEFKF